MNTPVANLPAFNTLPALIRAHAQLAPERRALVETSGATADGHGAHAVHTHMTNTRITDPEVFEHRFPVRLLRFAIRPGSGGEGLQRGGNGVIRQIMFLQPMTVSVLSQRRGKFLPFGLHGGQPGACGENHFQATGGSHEQLPSAAQFTVQPGDVLTIQTPGGGGWGD